jgi:hypothetical protein
LLSGAEGSEWAGFADQRDGVAKASSNIAQNWFYHIHFASAFANFTNITYHKRHKCSRCVSILMQLATYMKTSTRKTKQKEGRKNHLGPRYHHVGIQLAFIPSRPPRPIEDWGTRNDGPVFS